MTKPMRAIRLGQPGVIVDRRDDGTLLVRGDAPLEPHPDKLTLCLERWARDAPDRVFLAQRRPDGGWRELTYAGTLDRVRRIAQALLDRNLSAERGIAILSGNGIEHALLGLAAQYVGVPYAPVSTAYSLVSTDFGKLRHVLGLVTPGLVFAAEGERFERALRATVPAGVEVVVGDAPSSSPTSSTLPATPFAALTARAATPEVDEAHARVGPDTVAKLLFTSGSTGLPKGVINTQRMQCSNQQMLRQVFTFLAEEPPVLVDWLPWNHTFGGNHNFNMALYNGGTFCIDEGRPVADGVLPTVANLRDVAPTMYFNVPKGYEALVPHLRAEPELRRRFFSRLKALFYAGAGLSPYIWDSLEELAVDSCGERIVFVTSLGSTETAPAALIGNRAVDQPGIVGVPAPGVEVKLVPSGEKLELRLRGPNVTPGYWRQDAMTAKAFDEEGFYRMGDALRFFDDARPELGFVFDGRISEDFKLATGTWVSVSTMRAGVLRHFAPLVSDVVIAGHDRDDVAMLIVPDVPACRDHCADFARDLPDAEVLRRPEVRARFQELLDGFALTGTGSSNRIGRAILLEERPSLDAGEITDKGSLNQRAVLTRRAAQVEALYAPVPGPDVLVAARHISQGKG
ncbi:feruloyl-CoA synthase [Azospirillum agricola]|uniref:feruloyl-CoA synthase n=1 Tax=Azospirillum agricola TaxID=1720247 RepID=UPI001AEB76FA|nr:feruloyl-CoA synthase [Azospirillum agricola]MBP2227906.1 feruloyl-CoA synthase [Azospirillum agricola]